MSRRRRSGKKAALNLLLRYGIAVLAVVLVFVPARVSWVWIEPNVLFLFLVAVTVSAWYGGTGPGVLATVLALVLSYLFLPLFPPRASLTTKDLTRLGIFTLSSLLLSLLNGIRRQAEEDSAESAERFRLFTENVKDYAIFMLDLDGHVTSWNSGAEHLHEYRAEEIIRQPHSRFYTREDIERGKPEQDLESAAADGRFEDQGWQVRKDGTRFWANVAMTALEDEHGHPRGFAYVTRDLTQRKRIEEERTQMLVRTQATRTEAEKAAETIQRFQSVTEATLARLPLEDLLKELLDRLGTVLVVATRAILLLEPDSQSLWVRIARGIGEEEIERGIGIPLSPRFTQRIVAERRPVSLEDVQPTEVPSATLREKEIKSLLGAPLLIEDRVIGLIQVGTLHPRRFTEEEVHFLQIVADRAALAIERARLDKAVHGARAELEHRVAERTAKLQEANAELEGFAYTVSHDLRAPLRAMQGFSQALLEDYATRMDTIAQDYAKRIIAAARRMDTMIQDLLSYSRLSRTQLQLHAVNLTAVMAEVLTALEAVLKERQAQVTVEEPLLQVVGHHSTLVHILMNLLTNAIKFMAPGTIPQIRVWTETRDWWVRLWVEDNGIGIDPQHQERIFRVFERLHGMDMYPGTGMGLAIVRKGVEGMGGQVGVESGVGQGSRFWVELQQSRDKQ
ncbi:MAG: ATP-binding protein [Candidatus Binatia bacterium]